MRVYTVHAPVVGDASARVTADRAVFVRDGFHVWAFVFGLLWLLYHRLWWASLGYVVVLTGVTVVLALLHVSSGTDFLAMLLLALLMGFEAASLRRWTLSRRKWRQLDVVVANDEQEAERRFFDRWTLRQNNLVNDQAAVDRGAPPPTREVAGQAFSRPPSSGIVGLFPEPGGSA